MHPLGGTVAAVREQALEQSACSDEHLPASSRTDRAATSPVVQNVRRGHDELAVEVPAGRRLTVAFDDFALAI
jgi:hypothetical protein